jgi:hypothetical protein
VSSMSRFDYFLLMFPPRQLAIMLELTTGSLVATGKKATTMGELIKFFGLMILATRHEFTSRASLGSTTSSSKYTTAVAFGMTGTLRTRFDDLWSHLKWSDQPPTSLKG